MATSSGTKVENSKSAGVTEPLEAYKAYAQSQFIDLEKKISSLDKKFKASEKKFNEMEVSNKNASDKFDEKITSEIESVEKKQINVIQTLSIFVAFFTFVSVEFRILTSISTAPHVLAYTLVLLGALAFFTALIDTILNQNERKNYWLVSGSLFLIVLGIITVLKFPVVSKVDVTTHDTKAEAESNIYVNTSVR